jgi:hypothetical protein
MASIRGSLVNDFAPQHGPEGMVPGWSDEKTPIRDEVGSFK